MCSQKNIRKCFAGLLALMLATSAASAVVSPGVAKVTRSYAYPNYGGGDFIFQLDASVAGCEDGYFLKAADPGIKASIAIILAAQATGKSVHVYGESTDRWSGSGGNYCHATAVGLVS